MVVQPNLEGPCLYVHARPNVSLGARGWLVPIGDGSVHTAGSSVPRDFFLPVFSPELPKAGTFLPFFAYKEAEAQNG